MDILRSEAERIAEELGANLHPGRCACGWPLLEMRNQDMAFCVNCTRNLQFIQRTYALLEKIVGGIVVRHIGNDAYVDFKKDNGQW